MESNRTHAGEQQWTSLNTRNREIELWLPPDLPLLRAEESANSDTQM
jgi:hypothetical protein